MARRRKRKGGGRRRQPAALRRYWARHRKSKGGGGRRRRVRTRGVWGRSGTRSRPHRPRLLGSPGHFRSSTRSPWHHYRVNPHLLREVGMAYGMNPRHRRRRYHHNPGMLGNLKNVVANPMDAVMEGTLGVLSAYLTISIPNWLLPFPGSDLMSRLLRAGTRIAAGGLVYSLLAPLGSRDAVRAGAAMGAVGSTIFDFIGTRVIIGASDTGQTPLALLAPLSGGVAAAPVTTTSAYARLSAYSRPMLPAARGQRATTIAGPAAFPARGLVRHNLF